MSDKSFMSMFMGSPQLEQLNDDLRTAELDRQAPRLALSESAYKAIVEDSCDIGGKHFDLINSRGPHPESSAKTTLGFRSLGFFQLEDGHRAYFAIRPTLPTLH